MNCQRITASYPANGKVHVRAGVWRDCFGHHFRLRRRWQLNSGEGGRGARWRDGRDVGYRDAGGVQGERKHVGINSERVTTRRWIYEIPAGPGPQMVVDGISWKKN